MSRYTILTAGLQRFGVLTSEYEENAGYFLAEAGEAADVADEMINVSTTDEPPLLAESLSEDTDDAILADTADEVRGAPNADPRFTPD